MYPSASTQSVLSWRKPYSRLFERSRPQEVFFFFFFFKSQLFCLPIPNFAFSVHHSSATKGMRCWSVKDFVLLLFSRLRTKCGSKIIMDKP
ncbi:hypothetical protein H5410_058620 [Solanum commersonii]|uniref:Uncharacterized protein n=1 Tax=Solanum commersonii TaxID=4109 RepID=A0A9J5WU56_SOLCO|nr:hypothetical protein H5410_058620 [Solanum commersonii]